jgi:predicted NUDIX family NTP pyrophosphohydrolase
MAKMSAGVLLFRKTPRGVEVLLVHPGGPFWAKKDEGAWSIPKGLADEDEDLLAAARREFLEETGLAIDGAFLDLGRHKQPGGKTVVAFAWEGDFDPALLRSNMFSMEWPPRSGRMVEFPEVDKAGWFDLNEAARRVTKGQRPIVAALAAKLGTAYLEPPENVASGASGPERRPRNGSKPPR